MIIRKKLVNKYYSEKLYSTGNDNLDSLLEKAFCDGYEYAQREFSKEEKEDVRMDVAREILDAQEAGNRDKVRELKKRFVKKDRRLGKIIGTTAGALGGGLLAGQSKKAKAGAVIAASGAGALAGRIIGGGIGRRASNDRYDNYMTSVERERRESKEKNQKK